MAGAGRRHPCRQLRGQQLPPKSQIKSIRITRDQFAAENHSAGGLFIDIITQPGIGPLRGSVDCGFRDGSLSGKNPFAHDQGPGADRRTTAATSAAR